ncbi:MAG: methylmalonyl-CoA carboxyltransferase, partial [Deltaproteobacteria bacterium]
MKSVSERIGELEKLRAAQLAQGGEKSVAKQHAGSKLTARERLELLFDPGTFTETDMFVRHRCTDFGMDKMEIAGDGVVTGFGLVDGRKVFAYSQDFTSRAGTMGEMQSKKICKIMDMALKAGCPVV